MPLSSADNDYVLRIAGFQARLDKSKVYSKPRRYDNEESRTVSPYFPAATGKKPLVCSLTKQEADAYGYQIGERPIDHRSKSVIANFPLLEPSLTKNRLANLKEPEGEGSDSKLKANIETNVIKATPMSMSNACKRYPSITNRQVLNKYTHLFGLKPF